MTVKGFICMNTEGVGERILRFYEQNRGENGIGHGVIHGPAAVA